MSIAWLTHDKSKGAPKMDEIREKLKPHLGKRVKIRGSLSAFSDWTHKYRDIGRACISQPEMDGEVIASHVWVMGVQHWLDHKADIGKQVEFEAVVNQYADPKVGGNNYYLINPDELRILHDPPAFRISDPSPDVEVRHQQEELTVPNNVPDDKPVANDPLEVLHQVKSFVKAVGGQEQAEIVATALEAVTIPVLDLIAWIKALGG
jgi:hypothetical protein